MLRDVSLHNIQVLLPSGIDFEDERNLEQTEYSKNVFINVKALPV